MEPLSNPTNTMWPFPYYAAIATPARQAPVHYIDETPWFLTNTLQWLWVMVSDSVAFYMIHPHRSQEAFATLIDDWAGVLVSDGYGVYQTWVECRQTCLAHPIRTARSLAARQPPELAACGAWALAELQRLCHMAQAPPTGGEWRAWYARLCKLIDQYHDRQDEAGRFARRLLREMDSLWVLLVQYGVESTNNRAERALRFGVLWRKRSLGTASGTGNRWVARILSLKETGRLHARSTYTVLVDAVSSFSLANNRLLPGSTWGRTPRLAFLWGRLDRLEDSTMRLSAMRFILALALCVLVVSPAAHAQPVTKVYRSGYVRTGTAAYTPSWDEAFKQRRQELGYTAGQNLVIEARFANGQGARLPVLVEEMVQLQVDCLAAGGTLGTLAAKQATSTIPIVMLNASDDPVRLGLITSLARPGGDITGVIDIMEHLAGKRLELLQEAFPHIAPVGHLSAQNVSPAVADLQEVEAAARLQGVRVHPLPVQGPEELEQAFQSAREERAEALIVVGAGCPLSHRKRIVQLVDTLRVPVMYSIHTRRG